MDAYADFVDIVRGKTALAESGMSTDHALCMGKFLESAWITTQGSPHIAEHNKGASAGGTLADQVFIFAISRVYRYIYNQCKERKLLDIVHHNTLPILGSENAMLLRQAR